MTGETAFDMDDLEAIAAVLDINLGDLFPHGEGRSRQDFDQAPAGAAATVGQGSVSMATRVTHPPKPKLPTRPNGHPKPGPPRPGSPVPARKRRPAPVSR